MILDHPPNSKIEIKENQEFHLECRVQNAKPAAKIVWYRGKVELNIRKYFAPFEWRERFVHVGRFVSRKDFQFMNTN